MESQDIKRVFLWVGIGVAAAAAVLAIIFGGKFVSQSPIDLPEGQTQGGTSEYTQVETPQGTASVYAPGSSAITEEGEVVAPSGAVADNAALPGAGDSPQESYAIQPNQIPQNSVQISISDSAFSPAEITVSNGDPVVLTFISTGTDTSRGAIIQFEDASLSGLIVSLLPGETKVLTFNAPDTDGDYIFYRKGSAARGVMHVR